MAGQTIKPPPTRSVIAELFDAFPAVLGPRFWPRFRHVVAGILLLAMLRSVVADWSTVASGSMIPTLLVGDRVLVNKLAYDLKVPFTTLHLARWGNPQRGDVIIFLAPKTSLRLVKRVIGVPGDIVEMRDDVLYLNGLAANYRPFDAALAGPAWQDPGENTLFTERIATSGIPHAIMENHRLPGCRTVKPIHIPPGKFFVMGDNRDDSFDSRYFGLVDRSQILGRSGYILISLNQYCLLRLRRMLQAFP